MPERPDTPEPIQLTTRRWPAVVAFAVIPAALGILLIPALIVIFDVGIVEPSSAGWPFATVFAIFAAVMTALSAIGFAIGLIRGSRVRASRLVSRPSRRPFLNARKLRRCTYIAGAACPVLDAIVFAGGVAVMEALANPSTGPGRTDLLLILVAVVVANAGVGVLCARTSRLVGGICLRCGYDLTGNVTGRCSECGTEIARRTGEPSHAGTG